MHSSIMGGCPRFSLLPSSDYTQPTAWEVRVARQNSRIKALNTVFAVGGLVSPHVSLMGAALSLQQGDFFGAGLGGVGRNSKLAGSIGVAKSIRDFYAR